MSNSLNSLILKQKREDKVADQFFMENHYKELLQHCLLFAFSKVGFFKHAAFHGGTCLRIVDKIKRFSEDLDFAKTDPETTNKKIAEMMDSAVKYLNSVGMEFEITHNKINNNIQKIWIKEGNLANFFLDRSPR